MQADIFLLIPGWGPACALLMPDNVSPPADIVADEQTPGCRQNPPLPERPQPQIHSSLNTQSLAARALCVGQEMRLLV